MTYKRPRNCYACGYLPEWHPVGKCEFIPWVDPGRSDSRVVMLKGIAAVTPPPLIPARLARGPEEVASGSRLRAANLERVARYAGWVTELHYAMRAERSEMSALKIARGDRRAVATWVRPPDGKWGTGTAWSWAHGKWPLQIGTRELEKVITS